jgi:hypothetical protein
MTCWEGEMQIDSSHTSGWYVSWDDVEKVSPGTMKEWANQGWVNATDDYPLDGSVYVTLPEWTCSTKFYPSTPEGLRISDLRIAI